MIWRLGLIGLMCLASVARGAEPLPVPPPPDDREVFAAASTDDLAQRLIRTQEELETLRQMVAGDRIRQASGTAPAAYNDYFGLGCDGCDSYLCDGSGCDMYDCGSRATSYFGVEFGFLRPQLGALSLPGGGVSITPEHDFEVAPRVFAGFETETGFGGQISYWEIETTDPQVASSGIGTALDYKSLDVDLRQRGEFANWSLEVGAGVRWGRAQLDLYNLVGVNDRLRSDFEGGGPSLLIGARRPFGRGGWAFVGEARGSFLFGDTDLTAQNLPVPEIAVEGHLHQVWEGRFGVEWSGTTPGGDALFFVRGLLEAQVWEMAPIAGLIGADVGYLGPTLSMGFAF